MEANEVQSYGKFHITQFTKKWDFKQRLQSKGSQDTYGTEQGICDSYIEASCHKSATPLVTHLLTINFKRQINTETLHKPQNKVGSPHHNSDACKHDAHNPARSGTSFHMLNLDNKESALKSIYQSQSQLRW